LWTLSHITDYLPEEVSVHRLVINDTVEQRLIAVSMRYFSQKESIRLPHTDSRKETRVGGRISWGKNWEEDGTPVCQGVSGL